MLESSTGPTTANTTGGTKGKLPAFCPLCAFAREAIIRFENDHKGMTPYGSIKNSAGMRWKLVPSSQVKANPSDAASATTVSVCASRVVSCTFPRTLRSPYENREELCFICRIPLCCKPKRIRPLHRKTKCCALIFWMNSHTSATASGFCPPARRPASAKRR